MKKLLKVFRYLIISLFLFVIVLIVVAKLAENTITDIALKKVSKSIKAPMAIDDVSFTLLRRFPLATIEFRGVWMGSPNVLNPADSTIPAIDTIARIRSVYVSVKSKPLLKKKFEIMKVEIKGADFNYKVDENGISNIDFLLDTTQVEETDTASTPLDIILQDLILRDISCNYADASLKAKAKLSVPQIKIKGKAENETFVVSAIGSVILTDCAFDTTNLFLMNKTEVEFNLRYSDNTVSMKDVLVTTDGGDFEISGMANLSDDISTDIKIKGLKLDIGELLKYAPSEMLIDAGIKNVTGILDFDASVKGMVSDSVMPNVELNLSLKEGNVWTTEYPALKNISFSGYLTNGILNNNQTSSLDFKNFHFETEQSKVDLDFSLQDIDHPKYHVKTTMELNLGEFKKYIPDTLVRNVEGKIKASFSTKGQLPDSIDDKFADYILENSFAEIDFNNVFIDMDSSLAINSLSGQLSYKPKHIKANNLKVLVPLYNVAVKNSSFDALFSGDLTQLSKSGIDIKSFSLDANHCIFNGSGSIKNFDNPDYKINSTIKLNLGEIKKLLPDSLVNQLSGEISGDFFSAGKINLDSIADQMNDLIFESSAFNLIFDDVSAVMPDTLVSIDNFSGQLNMKPDTITIHSMSGVYSGINFKLDSTRIVNLYNSYFKNLPERLYVDGVFELGDIDYTTLIPFLPPVPPDLDSDNAIVLIENTGNKGSALRISDKVLAATPDTTSFNFDYVLKGKLSVKSFTYDKQFIKNVSLLLELSDSVQLLLNSYLTDKIFVEDISGLFNVTDSLYIIDQLKFNAFNGEMNTSAKYALKDNGETVIDIRNNISRMDIRKLLIDCNNFDQTEMTSDKISGLLSANINTRIVMLDETFLDEELRVKADLKLENGGVFNYERAMELSKFTGIKELDNMNFKTLETQLFIFKKATYVPKTRIVSNAMDITAFGMQGFGEDYEYHLQIHLGAILLGQSKKLLKEQAKMGDIVGEDTRSSVFLVSSSDKGKSKNGFDNKNLRKKMEVKINAQEAILNLRFHPTIISYETGVSKQ
ncbi:MAG: AsmA family protein [Bacteroidales bacterium]|nr:AsmA family protein [Bacteroidales bacterium]